MKFFQHLPAALRQITFDFYLLTFSFNHAPDSGPFKHVEFFDCAANPAHLAGCE
jgi:hypothetical protein